MKFINVLQRCLRCVSIVIAAGLINNINVPAAFILVLVLPASVIHIFVEECPSQA